MTRDPYSGQDLLADVFGETTNAPLPLVRRNRAGGIQSLWANPADPRWHVVCRLDPDGDIAFIDDRSVRFRQEETA